MDTENTQDLNDVKKCLKDAGLFEENMDTKVMLQYYNAIKNSENTACAEDEVRKSKRSPESKVTKAIAEEGLQFEESDEEIDPIGTEDIATNFCDMPPVSEKLLDVVYHKPKYFLAVNYQSDSYKKLSIKQKVNLLYKYHTNLSNKMVALAKKSLYPAPRCKEIQASNKFSGSLLRSTGTYNEDIFDHCTEGNIYTSRSGRQIKRKMYTEDLEEEEQSQSKKTKNKDEDEWHVRRYRTANRRANNPEQLELIVKKDGNEDHPSNNTSKTQKIESQTPLHKRNSLKRLTNEEIIKRSSLFSPAVVKRTRAETLFDKLKEEEVKNEQIAKEMELFEKTLPDTEFDLSQNTETTTDDVDSQPVLRKRPAGRKPINSRKRITDNEATVSESKPTKKITRNAVKSNVSAQNSTEIITEASDIVSSTVEEQSTSKTKTKMVDCPLCNVAFPEEDIQEHASACCELSESEPPTLRSSVKRLTCEICDKTLLFDTNYEVHVQQCLELQKRKVSI